MNLPTFRLPFIHFINHEKSKRQKSAIETAQQHLFTLTLGCKLFDYLRLAIILLFSVHYPGGFGYRVA